MLTKLLRRVEAWLAKGTAKMLFFPNSAGAGVPNGVLGVPNWSDGLTGFRAALGVSAIGGNEFRFDGVPGMTYVSSLCSSTFRFFFEIKPVDMKATGFGLALLNEEMGVAIAKSSKSPPLSTSRGRPAPIGKDRPKFCWNLGTFGSAWGIGGREVVVPVSSVRLEPEEEAVSVCESGCGC